MKKAEIVVIGGGVVGASVAYHLTEKGAKDVLILERAREQGSGSTGKATGGVRAQFETEINIKMSLYSLDFFNHWEFDCAYGGRSRSSTGKRSGKSARSSTSRTSPAGASESSTVLSIRSR
jgi:glycine/D-amino acid oxidase-like deaminating enzyme